MNYYYYEVVKEWKLKVRNNFYGSHFVFHYMEVLKIKAVNKLH